MLALLAIAAILVLLLMGGAIAWETRHPARRTLAWALVHQLPADPGEMGLSFEEWCFDCPDGLRLPVWDIALSGASTPRDDAPSRPTLVLLHGWGRSRIDSLGRLAAILDAVPGHFERALLPDLRGHGEAARSTSRLGDGEERDLLSLMQRLGDTPVVLAGHSLGATIAIRAAALQPRDDVASPAVAPATPRVQQVIAWAPYEEVATPIVNRLRAAGAATRPFTDSALLLLRLSGVRRVRTSEGARQLAMPLLVVAGREDRVSPLAECEAIAAAAPQGRCVVLPGGHPDMHRVDAAAHAAALRTFLGPG